MWLDPLIWICDACGATHTFFDSARDGYDGRLGHGTSYYQATDPVEIHCPACNGRSLNVQCGLIYNIDASELDEDLEPGRVDHLTDLFDALDVNARCASCHTQFNVGAWELA